MRNSAQNGALAPFFACFHASIARMGSAFRVPLHVRRWTVVLFAVLAITPQISSAGFGITPPYVNNQRLTRGTVYEQKITLVRSDPVDDLKTTITMNIPGIEAWFSVDRGTEFIIPKGTTQMPIIVRVQVPEDAEYKAYSGIIRIRTAPAEPGASGGVSIALGAQVDVDIEVVDQIFDFEVRRTRNTDVEEGRRKWGLYFPGKIRFFMTVENTGNTTFGPTLVKFDIYDSQMETLMESTTNTNEIEQIEPFGTKEVMAELPTRLPPGRYAAKFTVYKLGEEIAVQNDLVMTVAAIGTVAGYTGYGFDGLSPEDKIKVAIAVVGPLLLILLTVFIVMRRSRAHKRRVHASARH